jgi:hypothetical protein
MGELKMKKLVLGSLLLIQVLATGCIISTGDDGVDPIDEAQITASWRIQNIGTAQTNLPCPPNITTAAVYSQEVNTNFDPVGQPIIDLFDCDNGSGATAPLPATEFQVWVELTSEGGGNVYAESPRWPDGMDFRDRNDLVDVTEVDKPFDATLYADGGYFSIGWNLRDAGNGQTLTCAQAIAAGVGVLSTSVSNASNSADDQFNCEAGFGITGGFLGGQYTVDIQALNSANQALGGTPVLTNRTIGSANAVTSLGTVDVLID